MRITQSHRCSSTGELITFPVELSVSTNHLALSYQPMAGTCILEHPHATCLDKRKVVSCIISLYSPRDNVWTIVPLLGYPSPARHFSRGIASKGHLCMTQTQLPVVWFAKKKKHHPLLNLLGLTICGWAPEPDGIRTRALMAACLKIASRGRGVAGS